MVKSAPDVCPKFFKVFLPDSSSKQLKIPPAFVKHFNGVLHCQCTLSTPGNKAWLVDLENCHGEFFFNKGWEEFVKENSLGFGDFLTFAYLNSSRFVVQIYGRNGCEKANAITETNHAVEKCDNKSISHDHDKQINDDCVLQRNERSKPRKCAQLLSKEIRMVAQRSKVSIAHKTAQRKDVALEAVSKCTPKYPQFQIVMRTTYISRGSLNIPCSFVKTYGKQGKHIVSLCTANESWPVTLTTYKECCKLGTGWLRFVRENALAEGDICLFELVKKDNFRFNVSITRCPN